MLKRTYFAVVHDLDGLWCEFPDFAACYTQGETLEELVTNAAAVLDAYVTSMVEHGDVLPEPSNMEAIKAKAAACEDEVAFIVPLEVYPPAKTERFNVIASGDKLAKITNYAKRKRISRSELLVTATLEYIKTHR